MKLNMANAPKFPSDELEIGNVYRCRGGPGSNHKFWVVVGLPRDRVVMLGIDEDGNIVSSANYGQHVFRGPYSDFKNRQIVGRCRDMSSLAFTVDWESEVFLTSN